MKKIFSVLMLLLLLTGCGGKTVDDSPPENDASQKGESVSEASAIPGTYAVPEGWVRAEQYSTDDKVFFVQEGHEEDELPDNISINVGSNRYAAEEHEQFRDAILQQLMYQIQGLDAQLFGDGTYTDQGYVVYIFTIEDNTDDMVTTQYYIVGEQRYCLIHLTNFTGSEEADQAAQALADSFVWDESE